MSTDIITIMLSMIIFFLSFYYYARSINMSLSSPASMNEYFSGLFFLRRGGSLFWGRIALFLGFPLSYALRFIRDGEGAVYFPLIFITWLIALYYYKYAKCFDGEDKGFFSILLKGKIYGVAGTLLWLLRILYITSIIYAFLYR